MSFSTPVALFIFNRPELTQRVFEVIRKVKPKTLFIAADGPRYPEEEEKCLKARAIINQVDWDCDLRTDISDVNLGCAVRESSAFNWVFSEVEEAILLEDDTLPSLSFFRVCEELLDKYREDQRIMHISGNNFQFGNSRTSYSYYFSKFPHGWGWATWRRAWKYYDFNLTLWPEFKASGLINSICDDPVEEKYWIDYFTKMYEDPRKMNTYDAQWMFACWIYSGLAILPEVNLVTNIGFGADASHTTDANMNVSNLPAYEIADITHPPFIVRNKEADIFTFDYIYGGKYLKENKLRRKLFTKLPKSLQGAYKTVRNIKAHTDVSK